MVTVHPRACGEHMVPNFPDKIDDGSSPRLRGTSSPQKPYRSRSRFIPAPAGNIVHVSAGLKVNAVHPRACGEHAASGSDNAASPGSSPRLRGT